MANLLRYIWIAGIVLLMCSIESRVLAQQAFTLQILPVDKDTTFVLKDFTFKRTFTNPLQLRDYVKKLPGLFHANGYATASVDSVIEKENKTIVHLFIGEKYTWADIKVNPADFSLIQQAGAQVGPLKGKPFDMQQYDRMQDKLLNYLENNGYPFAKLSLDSLSFSGNEVSANLKVDKGVLYRIDSIRISGTAKISKNFIHRYLDMARGSLYKKERLDKINQRMLELSYLEQIQPWDITMLSTAGIVNLYLQPRKNNQVNILAGFLPNNQQSGKLLFTVDANLKLANALGGGEKLGIIWQQLQAKSPRIHIDFNQPFIFNSPFGIDLLFDLYKRDSTFLNINADAGLSYIFSANSTGKLLIQSRQTNVLEIDTFRVKNLKQLPDVADVTTINLGAEYEINTTDYRFNPRKGNEFSIFMAVGNKKIRKNTTITQLKSPGFDFNRLYDSIKLNTYLLRVKLTAAKYFPLGKQAAIKTGLTGGWLESPNFFRNELFQIGGYKLLRGFDEESIFTNRFLAATVEYRYIIGQNSNFFVFTDGGVTRNNILGKTFSYLGAGLGLNLETKTGIFNISYAAGKRNDLPFDIKQSKIHFGFTSIF